MPRPTTGRVPVTVRLDPEDVAWLDAASDDKGGIGRAEVLRRLVETQRRRGPAQWLPVKADDRPSVHSIVTVPAHSFKGQRNSPLRCETCGRRKADHR